MNLQNQVFQAFQDKFGEAPDWITRSPGRVNIIGEHTDYNDGFVLPMAINYTAQIALKSRPDSTVRLTALDMEGELELELDDLSDNQGGWQAYIQGVAWALKEAGHTLNGWDGVLSSEVPIGAGLASSAAVELALARAFALAADLEWDPREMALASQKAENEWVGANSGIMDQLISACGKEDHALLIDCRSLETQQVPLPSDTLFFILDTNTRRRLVDSEYNEFRAQCEAVACHFDVAALRDLTTEMLLDKAGILNLELYRRARHVISENQRVLDAMQAMVNDNPVRLGELMNQSHASLRDDFKVSSEELDQIVEIAQDQPGCFGARLTGAGFGGCAVALVKADQAEQFSEQVSRNYLRHTGLEAQVLQSGAAQGTSFEKIS